jgi:DNA-binding SARP family transcriptional activator
LRHFCYFAGRIRLDSGRQSRAVKAGGNGLRVNILGPLEASQDGTSLTLPRGRTALLLAILAMSAGHPVSVDRLGDLIWPEQQPERIRGSLHSLVARLRGQLGADAIATAADGYALDIHPDQVDLLRFRRLVRAADAASGADDTLRLLDEALRLWRGEPLSGARSAALDRDLVPSLLEERLTAQQRRADLALAAGRHDWVIAELRDLTSRYPFREPFWGQLIRAVASAGRPAEAIGIYHRARAVLADELGVDPSAELQDIYQQLLRADQSAARAGEAAQASGRSSAAERGEPRQLPAGMAGFTGRAAELKVLSELADETAGESATVVISAIGGMAGIGKTALAVHWAHQVAGRFPGGQLYANLRGFDPSGVPAPVGEVIRGFLDALGVPADRLPADLDAQAALYRTLLAGRRVLIVLDNASEAAQVRPLLPGSPGCMVVVTSRGPLTPLAAGYGARLVSLDVLSDCEAAGLLAARLGSDRLAAEPGATGELVALCGRLPLALAITAGRAAARPALPLTTFVADLRDTRRRLDALDAGDPPSSLRAVLSWSCRDLAAPAADMFRLLGIHPGPAISLAAAASLAGISRPQAAVALRELAALHLVTEHHPGRYVMHDLSRAYAAEQARDTTPSAERQAAIHRVLDHYLHTCRAADLMLSQSRDPITLAPPLGRTTPEGLDTQAEAMDWFDAERQVLLAVTTLAAEAGFDTHAWQIPWTLASYLDRQAHWHDWAAAQETALGAARRLGDQDAQALACRGASHASIRLGAPEDAREFLEQALRLYCDLGDRVGQARAHSDLSIAFALQQRHQEALGHSEDAIALSGAAGHRVGQANALNQAGWHAAHLGDYEYALACCQQALDLRRALGTRYEEAHVWDSLGYIHDRLGHHVQSIECFGTAVDLFAEFDDRFEQAMSLGNLGDACRGAGQPAAARDAWQRALDILDAVGHSAAGSFRARLAAAAPTRSVTP